jgi:2-methylisocitrate lyase-like PEP mutase family enzyme
VAGKQIIPVEEAVGKYRAAADVRDDLDLILLSLRGPMPVVPSGELDEAIKEQMRTLRPEQMWRS